MTRGERNGHALLHDADVREIRSLYLKGDWSMSDLALKFSVRKPTVQSILTGDNWEQLLAPGELDALRKMRDARRLHKR